MSAKQIYEFGPFRLDPDERLLLREGQPVALPPKVFETLLALVQNSGRLVKKDELMKRLWPDAFVEEVNLAQNISAIRRALGDGNGRYIETVPKAGYRFIAPVISGNGSPGLIAGVEPERMAPQIALRHRGSRLAGIAAAIVVAALATVYFAYRRMSVPANPAAGKIMLAVLPFQNYSPDAEREYLADGLTEEMISQLGSLQPERLGIIARTSAMKYKGTRVAVDQIGKDLGVDYVLEGSLRTEADRVRVTAQLIRVKDQTHLWARSYERSQGGILTMEQEVATAIANEIQLQLTPQHQQQLAALQFTDPRAYEAYARGRFFWNKRTDADLATAIQYFQQVLQFEPRSAVAYSGLADAYFYRSYAFGNMPPREGMPKAKAAALKAVELDPELAEAHTSVALVEFFYDWDWPGAEAEFKRAIELNPNYPTAHHGYAVFLLTVYGRWQDAIAEADRALELDPLSVPLNNIVALILVNSPQYDQAIARSKKLLELSPNYSSAYGYLSSAYQAKGLYREAAEASLKSDSMEGVSQQDLARLRSGYESGGMEAYRRLRSEMIIAEANKQPPHTVLDRLRLAEAYARNGNKEAALPILEKICDERSGMAVWMKNDFSGFPRLRSDPRFHELLRRIGLPN